MQIATSRKDDDHEARHHRWHWTHWIKITVRDGGIQITDDPTRFETYTDILTRHGLDELTIDAESAAPGAGDAVTLATLTARA